MNKIKGGGPWNYMLRGKLIEQIKPCLPGMYAHIKDFPGMFKVHSVDLEGFTIYKNGEPVKMKWAQFDKLKGGTSIFDYIE